MVDCEPWLVVAKLDHGQTTRLYHSQPWSTMVGKVKTMDGQTVARVTLNETFTKIKHQFRTLETPISRKKTNNYTK